MTPEYRKELAFTEAQKHMKNAKEKVVIVMPFEAAWIDPTDEAMDEINDFAADRKGSVHTFLVPKIIEVKEIESKEDLKKSK